MFFVTKGRVGVFVNVTDSYLDVEEIGHGNKNNDKSKKDLKIEKRQKSEK